MKRIIRYVTGFSFLVLGIAGLFLPVLQGVLFIIVGLLIFSSGKQNDTADDCLGTVKIS